MKLGIMQPYFLPYIGYFQLINMVDIFVVYDNIQYTKKGWINRNRLIFNGKEEYFTINIKKDSDYLDVCERVLSQEFIKKEKFKLLRKIENSYKKSINYNKVYPLVKDILLFDNENLFEYIYNSLRIVLEYLEITTKIEVSSSLPIDHDLKGKDKVIDICKNRKITEYINPIGGIKLYDKTEFSNNGIKLLFIESLLPDYKQFDNDFMPGLSIIDVMMHNSVDDIKLMMHEFKLI